MKVDSRINGPITPRLGLGGSRLVNLWLKNSISSCAELLRCAEHNDVQDIDVAWQYGQGLAEACLADFRSSSAEWRPRITYKVGFKRIDSGLPRRLEAYVSAILEKVLGKRQDFSAPAIEEATKRGARELQNFGLDSVLLHSPPTPSHVNKAWSRLTACRASGLTRRLGVSLDAEWSAREVLALPPLDVIQIPLRSLVEYPQKWASVVNERGVSLQVNRVSEVGQTFLSGLRQALGTDQPRPEVIFIGTSQTEHLDYACKVVNSHA